MIAMKLLYEDRTEKPEFEKVLNQDILLSFLSTPGIFMTPLLSDDR